MTTRPDTTRQRGRSAVAGASWQGVPPPPAAKKSTPAPASAVSMSLRSVNCDSKSVFHRNFMKTSIGFTINKLSQLSGMDRRTLAKRLRLAGASQTPTVAMRLKPCCGILKTASHPATKSARQRSGESDCSATGFNWKTSIRRGDYVLRDEVCRTFTRVIVAAKQRLLCIPATMAQKFAILRDPDEIAAELKREINAALLELSRTSTPNEGLDPRREGRPFVAGERLRRKASRVRPWSI